MAKSLEQEVRRLNWAVTESTRCYKVGIIFGFALLINHYENLNFQPAMKNSAKTTTELHCIHLYQWQKAREKHSSSLNELCEELQEFIQQQSLLSKSP